MRGTYERDDLYPWSLQMIGDKFVPQNLHTDERLAPQDTYTLAEAALRKHLSDVLAGTVDKGAALTR